MRLLARAFLFIVACHLLAEVVVSQTSVNFMVYILADNSASCTSVTAVNQLAGIAASVPTVRITILWQRSQTDNMCGGQTVQGVAPYTGTRIYSVTANTLTLITDLGFIDAVQTSTISSLLQAGSTIAATTDILMFFGPGGYFTFGSQNTNTINQAGWLYLQLGPAVQSAVAASPGLGGTLEIVWLACSFSASVENVGLFQNAASYLVGHESLVPKIDFSLLTAYSNASDLSTTAPLVWQSILNANPTNPTVTLSVSLLSMAPTLINNLNTLSRALRLFPQEDFAALRRSALETDPMPYPISYQFAVDLGQLAQWLTNYRPFPFRQKGLGPNLASSVASTVGYYRSASGFSYATGLSIFFPLSNTSAVYDALIHAYVNYTQIFDWVRFVFQYTYTIHNTFYFADPTITLTTGLGYIVTVNTTLDTVVQENVLFGIFQVDGNLLIGGSRQVADNFSTNAVAGSWDGTFFRIVGTTNFFPFVQQIRNINYISLVTNPTSNSSQLLKGVFANGVLTVQDWYVQDGPNVNVYNLTAGLTLVPASTKPYVLATRNFGPSEVETTDVGYTSTGNVLTLEKVPFGSITMYPDAYVFLMTRNIADQFGFVGWSISTTDPEAWVTPQLLDPPARFADYPTANLTLNFKQRVKPAATKLLLSFRNGGSQDISSAMATIVGFPTNFNTTLITSVSPRGACRAANSNNGPSTPAIFDAIMCQTGFIGSRSYVKIRITLPVRITVHLTLTDVSGPNVGQIQIANMYVNS